MNKKKMNMLKLFVAIVDLIFVIIYYFCNFDVLFCTFETQSNSDM